MRFQQLKRNPNAIMRKKLVKSKRSWVVVSSLSIAGGLLMMTAPGYVAKADVAPAATETVTKDTSSSPTKITGTETPKTTTSPVTVEKVAETPAPASDPKESGKNIASESPVGESASVTQEARAKVETPEEGTTNTGEETLKSQNETLTTAVKTPIKPTAFIDNTQTTPVDDTKPSTETPATDSNSAVSDGTKLIEPATKVEPDLLDTIPAEGTVSADSLTADAVPAAVPVAEVTAATSESGNGWTYSSTDTTLKITGQLDESDGTDKERWGGHTSDITTIDIQNPVIAPKDSSYLFANMTKLTDIQNLNNLQFVDSSGSSITKTTKGMFRNDSSIKSIDLSKNNLYYITDISHMFENDTSLENTSYDHQTLGISKVVDASYAYANDTSLVDPDVYMWQMHNIKDLTGMFKNDSNIVNLDLSSWYEFKTYPKTGDSSKGEGMFDGTDLSSIKINTSLYFDQETALTSTHGTVWENTYNDGGTITTPDSSRDFSGVPTFNNGVATGGIGSKFIGDGAVFGTEHDFTAKQAPEGSTVNNIVSIPTNHAGIYITVPVQGVNGQEITINDSDIPNTVTVDGVTYNKQTSSTPITAVITSASTNTSADSTVTYLGAAVPEGTINIPVIKNGIETSQTIPLDVKSGNVGGSTTIDLNKYIPEGYELKDPTKNLINITYNDSTTSPYTFSPTNLELVGSLIPAGSYNVPLGKDSTTPIAYDGTHRVGTTGTLPVPVIDGYTSSDGTTDGSYKNEISGTFGLNGFTPDHEITYTPIHTSDTSITITDPITGKTTTATIPGGDFGTTAPDFSPEPIDGYVTPVLSVTYGDKGQMTVKQGDTVIDADHPAVYTPVHTKDTTINVTDPTTGKTTTATIPGGDFGTTAPDFSPEPIDGYVTPVLSVTYGDKGQMTVKQGDTVIDADHPAVYTPVHTKDTTINVTDPTTGKPTTATVPGGDFGTTAPDFSPEPIDGYVTPVLSVTYGDKGQMTVKQGDTVIDADHPAVYTPVHTKDTTINVTDPTTGKTTTATIPGGDFGTTAPDFSPEPIDGYVTPVLSVTYGDKGQMTVKQGDTVIDADHPAVYTPVHTKDTTINVTDPTTGKTTTATVPGGDFGTTAPDFSPEPIDGYVTPVLSVTYGDKGQMTVKQGDTIIDADHPVVYTGNPNKSKTLTVKNPDGTISQLTIPAGNYGDDTVPVTAPEIAGYKAPSLIVSYNKNGIPTITDAKDPTKVISDTDVLSYTKNPSHGGSTTIKPVVPTTPSEGTIEHKTQTISTYSDKPDVELYQLGADNKMAPITNRSLATASNWYSDATITVDGISYFRVATNEWAKVGEVYPYQALNLHIRTYDDSEKDLYKAENVLITKETLAPSSSWITDRETYVINNTKYYRVATNEFVNADDVYVYSPVNMVVTTHADKYTTLYTAKGAEVTNRTLSDNTSWKVDSITYINGDKYYRVATNEFVKASDVDIRNYR